MKLVPFIVVAVLTLAYSGISAYFFFTSGEGLAHMIIFGVIGSGASFLAIIGGIRMHHNKVIFKNATEHQERAKVLAKTSKVTGTSSETVTEYFISFEFPETNHRINFPVDDGAFALVIEGDVGLLRYKQHKEHFFFVDFCPSL